MSSELSILLNLLACVCLLCNLKDAERKPSVMSLSSALQNLATYRTNKSRASQDAFDQGIIVLKSQPKLDDDG